MENIHKKGSKKKAKKVFLALIAIIVIPVAWFFGLVGHWLFSLGLSGSRPGEWQWLSVQYNAPGLILGFLLFLILLVVAGLLILFFYKIWKDLIWLQLREWLMDIVQSMDLEDGEI